MLLVSRTSYQEKLCFIKGLFYEVQYPHDTFPCIHNNFKFLTPNTCYKHKSSKKRKYKTMYAITYTGITLFLIYIHF